ncbi:MAG: crotonase/enoyl-CoA hydratase family protein [Betaproteobacteria bacterium]|jgi:DSF synthase|nr:crotonase/enoyl-CoA hydratase family protein [Betaproteobacteria bacterium]MDH5343081.1 crotonase/enoyl-CoA hydratase family protein [Betaproteobacteria bacterium]
MEMQIPSAVIDVHHAFVKPDFRQTTEFRFSPQLSARYDRDTRALWSHWTSAPRPCFNPGLLADIRAYYNFIGESGGRIDCGDAEEPIEYVILASGMPGVFNLGGDLDLFRQKIDNRDRNSLTAYGRACIDVLYRNYIGHGLPITTVSLVQGECLGGGFEAALSSDVIVAEKSSRFGFPEIMFNLFPGMGAYSFLDRKVGQRTAEAIISSGKIYTAEEMRDLGVIDVVAEDGAGNEAIATLIKQRSRARNGLSALASVRRRVHQITYDELIDVVGIWVEAALRLTPRDLKLMQRLVSRQNVLQEPATLH